jgi:hypothetical protein
VKRVAGPLASLPLIASLAAALGPGCSQGDGTGSASGTLDVPDCWSGPFDLKPDFFAAVPSMSSDALQIRVQNGGDFETFSDGLAILVDDAGEVRGDPTADGSPRPSLIGQTLVVALAPDVTPPGVPIVPVARPAIVHAALYLDKTCRTQNLALYAMDAVTLNPDGTCARPEAGEPPPCGSPDVLSDAGLGTAAAAPSDAMTDATTSFDATVGATTASDASSAEAGPAIGTSTIVFNSLFDGNPAESNAQERLTDAQFDFFFADPREVCPGGLGPPPRCRGHLTGFFKFYFERGRPAQPFP